MNPQRGDHAPSATLATQECPRSRPKKVAKYEPFKPNKGKTRNIPRACLVTTMHIGCVEHKPFQTFRVHLVSRCSRADDRCGVISAIAGYRGLGFRVSGLKLGLRVLGQASVTRHKAPSSQTRPVKAIADPFRNLTRKAARTARSSLSPTDPTNPTTLQAPRHPVDNRSSKRKVTEGASCQHRKPTCGSKQLFSHSGTLEGPCMYIYMCIYTHT